MKGLTDSNDPDIVGMILMSHSKTFSWLRIQSLMHLDFPWIFDPSWHGCCVVNHKSFFRLLQYKIFLTIFSLIWARPWNVLKKSSRNFKWKYDQNDQNFYSKKPNLSRVFYFTTKKTFEVFAYFDEYFSHLRPSRRALYFRERQHSHICIKSVLFR